MAAAGLTGVPDRGGSHRHVEQARCLVHIPSYQPRDAHRFPPLTTIAKGISDALTQFSSLTTTRSPQQVLTRLSGSILQHNLWTGIRAECAEP